MSYPSSTATLERSIEKPNTSIWNTASRKEIGDNMTDTDFGLIENRIQSLMSDSQFMGQAQNALSQAENVMRFYSTKGKFDQSKRNQYPIEMIIENASKSMDDKIIWIKERRTGKGWTLTDLQEQYIRTMEHTDIFSRTAEEWVQLIYDLKKNWFNKEQAFDVCDHGECGNLSLNLVASYSMIWLVSIWWYAYLYLTFWKVTSAELTTSWLIFIIALYEAWAETTDELSARGWNLARNMALNNTCAFVWVFIMTLLGMLSKYKGPITDLVLINAPWRLPLRQLFMTMVVCWRLTFKTRTIVWNANKVTIIN